MRERKVFEVSVAPDVDPIEFSVQFTKADGDTETHDFEADGEPGARGSLAVVAIIRRDERGKQVIDLNGMLAFFEKVMPVEDFTRLRDLIDRRDLSIRLDQLLDIMNWIVEEQSARPTTPSSISSNGRRTTGRRSTASRS